MKSPVVKRSVVIKNRKTSVSLEDAFWKGIKSISAARSITVSELVAEVNGERRHGNLSSALRLFVLQHYRDQASDKLAARASRKEAGKPSRRNPVAKANMSKN